MRLRTVAALGAAALLAGCVSTTQLVTNPQVSDTVKAKRYAQYREVLFVPPQEDPRHLVPRIVDEIAAMGFKVRLVDPDQPVEPAQGTAFLIGSQGWALTCAHVVGEQQAATLTLGGKHYIADVVKADARADLALLKLRDPLPKGTPTLSLRAVNKPAAMGEEVYTIGYPLSRMLGNSVRMTNGLLSATTGLHDDANQLQVSAEIQPGNSGGPLLDRRGEVIGVVSQTLDPAAVARATGGALPQNVNFAIKGAPVLDFLKQADAQLYAGLAFDRPLSFDNASKAVAKIQAGVLSDDDLQVNNKMLVRFEYLGESGMWNRFKVFLLIAIDKETQEPLFVAGQSEGHIMSTEDAVIHDTLEQFRSAVHEH